MGVIVIFECMDYKRVMETQLMSNVDQIEYTASKIADLEDEE